MDRLASLGEQLSQLTMYDLKSYAVQAKNMVLNVPEMEAKVLEATNDDAWGASSSLMQEIAQGTFNFQAFNEIMPPIYKRFMEKEAREWRQIYKALVLLEYLVKNGSERVVDDARSHVATVKMLRSFHYIDEKGKDQGINVRNRAKEIAELLSDVDKIRTERRKAKANRAKYTGVGNDGSSFSGGGGGFSGGSGGFSGGPLSGASFQTQTGNRYGGFGSESLAAGGGGGGGGYPGESYRSSPGSSRGGGGGGFSDRSTRPEGFEEYDAGDDEDLSTSTGRGTSSRRAPPAAAGTGGARVSVAAKGKQQQQQQAKAVDLFDFGDDDEVPPPTKAPAVAAPAPSLDDDFDDFQSAPTSLAPAAAPPKPTAAAADDLFGFLDSAPAAAPQKQQQQQRPAPPPSYAPSSVAAPSLAPSKPSYTSAPSFGSSSTPTLSPAPASKGGLGGFDDLWSSSLGSLGKTPSPAAGAGAAKGGKTMAQIEQEKRHQTLWGSGQPQQQSQQPAAGTTEDFLL